MIKHMFKLMWNRKRRNILLMIEMLVSFLVLFAIASTALGWGMQYLEPLGFDPDDIWVLHVDWEEKVKGQTRDDVRAALQRVEQEVLAFSEVEGICWTYGNTPYSYSTWRSGITWQGQETMYHYLRVSDNYAEVLRVPLKEGTWFGAEHDASAVTPVVIDQMLRETLFGSDGAAVGQVVSDEDSEYLVVGVVDWFRYKGEFDSQKPTLFERYSFSDTAVRPPSRAVIRVQTGTGVSLEKTLTDGLAGVVPGWSLRIENMPELRAEYFRNRYMMLLTPAILGGFLVFNVALGLFGVLWYSINRRKSELGLRRALGASAASVNRQILGEAMVMATFAIAVGVVLAVQAPVLGVMGDSVSTAAYMLAIVGSAVLIYLLALGCAWYPAHLAAKVQPAEALHDE